MVAIVQSSSIGPEAYTARISPQTSSGRVIWFIARAWQWTGHHGLKDLTRNSVAVANLFLRHLVGGLRDLRRLAATPSPMPAAIAAYALCKKA